MNKTNHVNSGKIMTSMIDNITNISYYEFSPKMTFAISKLNYWNLCFVDYGEVELSVLEQCYHLQEGICFLSAPGKDFSFETQDNPVNMMIIGFETPTKLIEAVYERPILLKNTTRSLFAKILHEAKTVFPQISLNVFRTEDRLKKIPLGAEELLYLYLSELLIIIARSSQENVPQETEKNFIKTHFGKKVVDDIIQYMEQNLDKNISVTEFADHFYVSPSYIKKFFKTETGFSLINFYRTLKMEKAKFWIREEAMTFTEISARLGYDTIHHFSNTFKKYTGLSPTAYKKSIQAIETKLDT